jgi:hypothetical protein
MEIMRLLGTCCCCCCCSASYSTTVWGVYSCVSRSSKPERTVDKSNIYSTNSYTFIHKGVFEYVVAFSFLWWTCVLFCFRETMMGWLVSWWIMWCCDDGGTKIQTARPDQTRVLNNKKGKNANAHLDRPTGISIHTSRARPKSAILQSAQVCL